MVYYLFIFFYIFFRKRLLHALAVARKRRWTATTLNTSCREAVKTVKPGFPPPYTLETPWKKSRRVLWLWKYLKKEKVPSLVEVKHFILQTCFSPNCHPTYSSFHHGHHHKWFWLFVNFCFTFLILFSSQWWLLATILNHKKCTKIQKGCSSSGLSTVLPVCMCHPQLLPNNCLRWVKWAFSYL